MKRIENYDQMTKYEKQARKAWTESVEQEALKYPWSYYTTLTYDIEHQDKTYGEACEDLHRFINGLAGIVRPKAPFHYLLGVCQHYSSVDIGKLTPYHIHGAVYCPSLFQDEIARHWRTKKIKFTKDARRSLGRSLVAPYRSRMNCIAYTIQQCVGGIYRTNIKALDHRVLLAA